MAKGKKSRKRLGFKTSKFKMPKLNLGGAFKLPK